MRRVLILLILIVLSATCLRDGTAAGQKPTGTSWMFETHADKDTTPHCRVYLLVSGRRVLIASDLTAQFSLLPRSEYKAHRVPAVAAAACSGWWAGQGEDFYVIRRHGHWEVFRRDLDEQAQIPAYRRVRSIPAV